MLESQRTAGPEWYWKLLESIRDGLLVVDASWRIVYLNGVAASLLRLRREQSLGQSLWTLLPPENSTIEAALRAACGAGAEQYMRELRPNGRAFAGRVFDVWTYPMPDGGLAVRFEDVSERVRRESELARLALEAYEANRAKSRFFAAVSHELRTPLNAIIGYAHLLRTEAYGEMTAGAKRAADRTGVCADHLARLVDDVLLMTTAEIGRLPVTPSSVRLEEFLPRAVEPLRMQAEAKGLRFGIRFAESLPLLETDPNRLRQLLSAVVSNAVKFTSSGEVRVEVDRVDHAAGTLEIAIVDTGPGVPPADRERIFDAFEQLGDSARSDSATRGTGLGLTLARRLAVLLHSEIRVDDGPEGGAAFRIRMPLRLPDQGRDVLEPEPPAAA